MEVSCPVPTQKKNKYTVKPDNNVLAINDDDDKMIEAANWLTINISKKFKNLRSIYDFKEIRVGQFMGKKVILLWVKPIVAFGFGRKRKNYLYTFSAYKTLSLVYKI